MNSQSKSLISALMLLFIMPLPASKGVPMKSSSILEPEQLRKQIESLRVSDHYWHKISWKKSLKEGLLESHRTNKPVFLWAFIDLPDTERC